MDQKKREEGKGLKYQVCESYEGIKRKVHQKGTIKILQPNNLF